MRDVRLILAVAAIGAWVAWRAADHESPASTSKVAPMRGAADAPPRPASAPGSLRVPLVAGADTSPHPGQTEVCGLGWFDSNADGAKAAAVSKELATMVSEGSHDIATRLMNDPAPFAQASGLLVESLIDEDDRRRAATAEAPPEACEGAACPGFDARASETAHLADGLARLASQTLDPRTYAIAIRICDRAASSPASGTACQLLSRQQWSRVDPGNVAPWLDMLRGSAGDDRSVVDEALFHIAKSTRYDDGFFAVVGEIARQTGNDDRSTMSTFVTSVDAIGVSAAVPLPLDKLLGACRGAALADSNRRQLCEGVADTLFSQSDSLLMASIGLRIGRYLGWDPGRGDALHGLEAALNESAALNQSMVGADPDGGCDGVKRFNRNVARKAAVGEMAWAREWLSANGKTEEAYTRKARENRWRSNTASNAATPLETASAPAAAAAPR